MNPGTAALSRGLDVLVALAEPEAARDGLGVARLTELIGADKSQLSRTLATLDEQGFVTRDPDTLTYRLGWRLFSLAARSGDAPLIAATRPVLLVLVAEFGDPCERDRRAPFERDRLGRLVDHADASGGRHALEVHALALV